MPPLVVALQEFFASRRDAAAAAVYLFGSEARGDAAASSDVDVAVLFERDPPRTLEGLHLPLQRDLVLHLRREVDLVVLNRAPVDLVHRVLRDGLLCFEADRKARVLFEVRARNEYFDLLPFLERYRRSGSAA
jgi:predicted nucleotidyltransferase